MADRERELLEFNALSEMGRSREVYWFSVAASTITTTSVI